MNRRTTPEADAQRAIVSALRFALPRGAIVHHCANEVTEAGPRGARRQAILVGMGVHPGFAEPMPPEAILMAEGRTAMPDVRWCRKPRHLEYKLALKEGKWEVALDGSKTLINRPGWLHLSMICRKTRMRQTEGPDVEIWSLSVFVVNRRAVVRNRRFAEMSYAFQVRMTVECGLGIVAGYDLTGYRSADPDLRTHDLHYHDVPQYAAGRSTACAHEADADGVVRRVRTEPMPVAEVERVAPNESITGVTFDMVALRDAARAGADPLRAALADLPRHYGDWIAAQSPLADQFANEPRRREMAQDLIKAQRDTMARIASRDRPAVDQRYGPDGIRSDERSRGNRRPPPICVRARRAAGSDRPAEMAAVPVSVHSGEPVRPH